jgi:hypothetical protein
MDFVMESRTDCRPRANNRRFRGEKGFPPDIVDEKNPFMIAVGIGSILLGVGDTGARLCYRDGNPWKRGARG